MLQFTPSCSISELKMVVTNIQRTSCTESLELHEVWPQWFIHCFPSFQADWLSWPNMPLHPYWYMHYWLQSNCSCTPPSYSIIIWTPSWSQAFVQYITIALYSQKQSACWAVDVTAQEVLIRQLTQLLSSSETVTKWTHKNERQLSSTVCVKRNAHLIPNLFVPLLGRGAESLNGQFT